MPRYDVYIPFTCSYEGEIADEDYSTIVKADNEKDAIQKALDELSSEYVVKTLNSDDITVEQIPDFPSFDEWEENFKLPYSSWYACTASKPNCKPDNLSITSE